MTPIHLPPIRLSGIPQAVKVKRRARPRWLLKIATAALFVGAGNPGVHAAAQIP